MWRDIRHRVLIRVLRAGSAFLAASGFVALCVAQEQAQQPPAASSLPAIDLQQISKAPARWPETVSVVAPVAVDLSMNGRKVGQATLLPSQKLKLVAIEKGRLLVAVGSIAASIDPEQTNFWQSYDARQQELAADKPPAAAAPKSAPIPKPSPSASTAVAEPLATPPRMGLSGTQTVRLTRHTSEKKGADLSVVTGRYYQPLPSPPSSLKSEPACASPAYFEISIAGQQVPLVVDFGSPGANSAKVFFDPKGGGDLQNAKTLSAQSTSHSPQNSSSGYGQYELGPLVMETGTLPGKKGSPFKLLITKTPSRSSSGKANGYLRMVPVEGFSGSSTFAGRNVDVDLVDADFDGRLAPGFRGENMRGRGSGPQAPFDCIAVDWNGDRQFDYRSEVLPLVSTLGFGGHYYELTPGADSSSLGIREIQPELGTLEKCSPDVGIVLVSENGVVFLDAGEKGEWKVPAGEYSTSYFRLSSKKGGVDWTLHGNSAGRDLSKISIQPGQTTALKVGAPLTPKFQVTWSGDTANIGFSLCGAGGEIYEAGGHLGGNRQPPPDFKILNREGKVLERGTFEYG